jgi:hypothetical protein
MTELPPEFSADLHNIMNTRNPAIDAPIAKQAVSCGSNPDKFVIVGLSGDFEKRKKDLFRE